MFDSHMLLRDGSVLLTATEATPTAVDMGADIVARVYEVFIPIVPTGTTPTLTVKIQESDDNSTWRDIGTFEPITTVGGRFYLTIKSNARYRRYVATVGGTTPSYGYTVIGVVPAGEYTAY
jgi:hypothetical protein